MPPNTGEDDWGVAGRTELFREGERGKRVPGLGTRDEANGQMIQP